MIFAKVKQKFVDVNFTNKTINRPGIQLFTNGTQLNGYEITFSYSNKLIIGTIIHN